MGLMAQFVNFIGVMYAGRLVEYGPVEEVLTSPLHPYTRLLIDSLPDLVEKRKLRGIPGLPPTLVDSPPGCAFYPRCPYQHARGATETPELIETGPGGRLPATSTPRRREQTVPEEWANQAVMR